MLSDAVSVLMLPRRIPHIKVARVYVIKRLDDEKIGTTHGCAISTDHIHLMLIFL